MNIILDKVTTNYVLHFEDDWQCNKIFSLKNYLEYLYLNKIQQIVLRQNCGGNHNLITKIEDNNIYSYIYNHKCEYKPDPNKKFDKDNNYNFTNNYTPTQYWWWPGFTLNPSIFDIKFMKERIGQFNENIKQEFFEYEYALRCFKNGAKINFVNLNIDHIGNEVSSYSLNDMKRYYDK